jgi:hypothetical protein
MKKKEQLLECSKITSLKIFEENFPRKKTRKIYFEKITISKGLKKVFDK